jgi:hypothetical protein
VLESELATNGAAGPDRRALVADLAGGDVARLLRATGGEIATGVDPSALPLASASVDLCHSGGTLEHYPPEILSRFLRESFASCARVAWRRTSTITAIICGTSTGAGRFSCTWPCRTTSIASCSVIASCFTTAWRPAR